MREDAHVPEVEERVLVLIDARPEARHLIRSAWRLAQGLRADLLIAYRNDDLNEVSAVSWPAAWSWPRIATPTCC